MKRFIGGLLCMVVVISGVATLPTHAQIESSMEGQLKPGTNGSMFQNVEMDCLDVKFKLSKVHENDGLNRVALGQLYDGMSAKLMGQLNSRIVSNRLDGSALVKTAAEYQTALENFKGDYQTYEEQMNALIKSDCSTQKVVFYGNLQNVQSLRSYVDNDITQLNRLIKNYRTDFVNFYDVQITRKQADK